MNGNLEPSEHIFFVSPVESGRDPRDQDPKPALTDLRTIPIEGAFGWTTRADPKFRELAQAGHPVVLVARNSGEDGSRTRESVHANARSAAKTMRDELGLDVMDLLPDASVTTKALAESTNTHSSLDARDLPFRNRFRVLRLVDTEGVVVYLALMSGSASKTTVRGLQPSTDFLFRLLGDIAPTACALVVAAFDRIARNAWAPGALIGQIRACERRLGAFYAVDEHGTLPLKGSSADREWFDKSQFGQRESERILVRTRSTMVDRSDTRMVNWRAAYLAASVPPPGLFVFRSRLTSLNTVCIDSPACYPDRNETLTALPDVCWDDGALVDQAGLIYGMFERMEDPDFSIADAADYMRAGRHSTQGHRTQHGRLMSSWIGDDHSAGNRTNWIRRLLKPIADNIDLYESGVLKAWVVRPETQAAGDRAGAGEAERQGLRIVIEDVFPPGGSWGPAAGIARFRALWEGRTVDGKERRRSFRSPMALHGLQVEADSHPGVLVTRQIREPDGSTVLSVQLNPEDAASRREALREAFGDHNVPPVSFTTPTLVLGLVRTLRAADGEPLRPWVRFDDRDDSATVQARLDTIARHRGELIAVHDFQARIVAGLSPESRSMPAALRARIIDDYTAREAELEGLDTEAESLRASLEAALDTTGVGADPRSIALLLAKLDDERTNDIHELLCRCLTDVRIRTEAAPFAGLKGARFVLTARLVFATALGPATLDVEAVHCAGAAFDMRAKALRALSMMRAGQTDRAVRASHGAQTDTAVGLLLGLDRTPALFDIRDPDVLRVAMAAVFPDRVPGEDPAEFRTMADLHRDRALVDRFGGHESLDALAQRLRSVHAQGEHKCWIARNPPSGTEAWCITHASRAPGTGRGGPTPVPTLDAAGKDLVRDLRGMLRRRTALGLDRTEDRWTFHAPRSGLVPQLAPCPWCGSVSAARARSLEITGYLCLDPGCRRDEVGVRFDHAFDRYLQNPDVHIAAGAELALPEGFDGDALWLGREELRRTGSQAHATRWRARTKWRSIEDLSESDKDQIAQAYADYAVTTAQIATDHGTTTATVRGVARAAGLPLRRDEYPGRAADPSPAP